MCSKKFKLSRTSGAKNKVKQRGQIFLLYALLVPLLFFFVGITFDLSWYYVNVSRMQNAADAAVIAGAQTLIGENGNLYYYVDKNFVNNYDSRKFAEYYQDTTLGDTVAKTYVRKNLARRSSGWDSDTIIDSWTRNELYFESTLLGDKDNDFETLYYHIMLEEDVPHMFLNGWFDTMNAKVSSVVKINRYSKSEDFFEQMKYLGFKRNRLAMLDYTELKNRVQRDSKDSQAEKDLDSINERSIFINPNDESLYFNGSDGNKNFFDYLFASIDYDNMNADIDDNDNKKYNHRIININEVYPVRDYGFYYDYNVLKKLRDKNPAYRDLDDRELASALAKDSSDPLFIYIESEPAKDSRQLIINVNVSNTNEFNDRPIVLIYDGKDNLYPVIFNLNADFRGILYAPNSQVAINGNEHDFQGFVIAQSYIALLTEDEDEFGDYNPIYEYESTLLVDDYGEVQYKDEIQPVSITNNEIFFNIETFNLNSSEFDTFNLVNLDNYTIPSRGSNLINNLFIQPPDNNY